MSEAFPHMCRDGHDIIGWRGEDEECPVCRMRAERDKARAQAEFQRRAWTALRDNLNISSDKAEVIVRLTRERDKLRAVLAFYADPHTYRAIGFLFDPPCGEFAEDFTDDAEFGRPMPGARARAALEGRQCSLED